MAALIDHASGRFKLGLIFTDQDNFREIVQIRSQPFNEKVGDIEDTCSD